MQIIKFIVNTASHAIKLYKIKQILNSIEKCKHIDVTSFELNTIAAKTAAKDYTVKLQKLKQDMFDCGFLYVKFFQWYISKLKSDIIQSNIGEQKDYSNSRVNSISYFISHFEDIFEQCPYHDIEHTKKVFAESMNNIELEDYIDITTFKEIASGSIGQVYYGKRKIDNLEVAIKVKHPNIKEDLENQHELINIIKIIQKISYFRNYFNIYINLDDFLLDINLQCDFNNEANNCKTFQDNFKSSSNYIVFPKVVYQSNDLLISEYIEGDAFENLTEIQKYHTSINFICFFYQMLLIDNFLHGDLHRKNWKVRNNKETNNIQIVVYDCGICFQNTCVELTNDFWFAIINYDVKALNKSVLKFICETTDNYVKNDKRLDEEINVFFNNVLNQTITTSVLIKLIIDFFSSNDIIVNKFLLNLSILVCVIEEFLKINSLIEKDKKRSLKRISMFEIINEYQLDIIAYCDIKNCYPEVNNMFKLDMNNKYKKYKSNIEENNIIEIVNSDKQLFGSLILSKLKFKNPC